jgi:hypothetical protein
MRNMRHIKIDKDLIFLYIHYTIIAQLKYVYIKVSKYREVKYFKFKEVLNKRLIAVLSF